MNGLTGTMERQRLDCPMINRIAHWLRQLLSVRTSDPEQARRGRILGILLLGIIASTILAMLFEVFHWISGSTVTAPSLFAPELFATVILFLMLYLNQAGRTQIASYCLLALLVAGIVLIDRYNLNKVDLLHIMPIAASSFLVAPATAFVFATLSSLGHGLAYWLSGTTEPFNFLSIYGMYMTALMAWLTATSLDGALKEVRRRAHELDRRVMSRTHDLVAALEREHLGASKLQAILQSIGDGVIVFDQVGRAILVNPAACAILEHRERDILGKRARRIMRNGLSVEDQNVIGSMVESKQHTSTTLKITWDRKTIALSFAPVRLPSAQPEGTVMVLRDITKEAEVDQMKSEFVSIVSHELRTPMTVIKGYLDLLALGSAGAITEMQRHYVSIIKTNTDRLSEMVNELLDLSRIEAGKAQMTLQAIAIRRIVYQVIAMLQKTFNDRGIRLQIDIENSLPDVLADPGRLTQIVTNLLSNAAKYTFEGTVSVAACTAGDFIQVDVTDTGIGMTEQDQAKLFGRFFRASTARERDIPGTGLGLSITRSLVEMHGGRIWVKSAVGLGSTFSFTVPKLPEPLAHMAPGAAETGPVAEQAAETEAARILVVDDELHIAQLFRYQLEKDGYTVLISTHSSDVLMMTRRERPDLILLDVMMPGMDGFEVLRTLKQEPDTQGISVIIISIVADEEKGFSLGAADYLTKPVDAHQLQATVRRVLAQRASGTPRSIMVVDDEADTRHSLSETLAKQGFVTSEAHTAQAALDNISARRPHLILLDLELPGMDGEEMLNVLKESPQTAGIPVVVMTDNTADAEQNKKRLMGMGAQQFLIKPIAVETLVREVRRQLA